VCVALITSFFVKDHRFSRDESDTNTATAGEQNSHGVAWEMKLTGTNCDNASTFRHSHIKLPGHQFEIKLTAEDEFWVDQNELE
jgi:hypothetical protein